MGEDQENDVMNKFEKDIYFNGERYVTKLPFKEHDDLLPDNFQLSKNRLATLKKRLNKNPQLLSDYDQIFKQYEVSGIIQRVSESDDVETGKIHYLSHRPVVRQDKETTKIRAVFDASAKTDGLSLNDCLYSGPNLMQKIFDILLRFRTNKIAILSDIKQAFLNIEITDEH